MVLRACELFISFLGTAGTVEAESAEMAEDEKENIPLTAYQVKLLSKLIILELNLTTHEPKCVVFDIQTFYILK